jgi:hypothetical protein
MACIPSITVTKKTMLFSEDIDINKKLWKFLHLALRTRNITDYRKMLQNINMDKQQTDCPKHVNKQTDSAIHI